MKLLRLGGIDREKPAALDHNGQYRDLSSLISDVADDALLPDSLEQLANTDLSSLPIFPPDSGVLPCVGKVGKFVCIGLNYRQHALEAGAAIPSEPVVFLKATSSIVGAFDDVLIPRGSQKTDWEVELGVVIGTPAKYVSVEEALNHVAGYCVVNDLSEREYQLERGGQWDKGKGCDTFGPIGPYLVTKDEIPDPQNLQMWLEVDGVRFQDSSTADMIFSVAELVSYCSHFFTLHTGDIISTGTPQGVGLGIKPVPVYLRPAQTIRLGIAGLGTQEQRTRADSPQGG
jgi:2-keto-4-pentenoate hydratase/2-oxohepta-3-ene-1,7-dioic acid hydratase in catechol pathway